MRFGVFALIDSHYLPKWLDFMTAELLLEELTLIYTSSAVAASVMVFQLMAKLF